MDYKLSEYLRATPEDKKRMRQKVMGPSPERLKEDDLWDNVQSSKKFKALAKRYQNLFKSLTITVSCKECVDLYDQYELDYDINECNFDTNSNYNFEQVVAKTLKTNPKFKAFKTKRKDILNQCLEMVKDSDATKKDKLETINFMIWNSQL